MFNCFKKYLLITMFLGLMPSMYAMENSQYRWPFNALAGLWSKLPSIPPILWGYKIRKEADRNIDIINTELLNILNTVSENGFTNENTSRIKILLACGADLNLRTEENKTLLHLAALYQNEELFVYLQNQKADVTIRDKNGNTPIDIKNANKKLEDILKTWPNLQEEQKQEKLNEIINCIKQGANPGFIRIREKKEIIPLFHWTNETTVSLLHWAVSHKQNTLVECLLLHGANPNLRDNQERTSLEVLFTDFPSSYLPMKINNNEMEIFKSLLQYNTDITIKFSYDSNALRHAIFCRGFEIVKMLIEHDSDVTKMYIDTALLTHALMEKCPISLVEMLCKAGILDDSDATIFHCIANGDMDTLYPNSEPQAHEYIETILTSARPPKVQEKKKKEIVYTTVLTIWTLKELVKNPIFSKFFPEIKWHILSFALPKKCFYNSKGMLYKAIYPDNYRNLYIFGKTEERVAWLLEILQKQDEEGKTASQLYAERPGEENSEKFLKLLNGTQIKENYEQFSENFNKTNPQNNLVRKIYDNIHDEVNKQYLKN